MAEQEACAELVDKASEEVHQSSGGQIEGESLIPLLQGLLKAPENDVTPDSGTESGEDQRSGLIAEVQTALDKLSASLRSDSTDITPERRSSLLQLVSKLQAGLASSTGASKERRASSSSQGRFQKRRQRQSRHTVGVSKEELADARRLIEEISLKDLAPLSTVDLQKQNSESSVTNANSLAYAKSAVKNAIPKPFSSSSISNTSSSIQTPTESLDFIFAEDKDITYHEPAPVQQKTNSNYAVTTSNSSGSSARSRQISLCNSVDSDSVSIKSVHQALQQAAASKILVDHSTKEEEESETEEEEEDEYEVEESTMKEPHKDLENAMLTNPIYNKNDDESFNSLSHEEKVNRFNTQSKKLKMKRANTIDIPKPLLVYDDEDSDDSDCEHKDENARRRNNYYALRGPIRVNTPQIKTTVPVLQPKTESDKKFLAFINKNSEQHDNKTSIWANNNTVWGNKFGNIKNTFEKVSNTGNSAKNFWKSADDAIHAGIKTQIGPKISRQSARNLQQMFEEKQRESQQQNVPWKNENVVTGSLQIKPEPNKQLKISPQPAPFNKFSHAPQSAFKPISKKSEPQRSAPTTPDLIKCPIKGENNDTMFLYAPKPMFSPPVMNATPKPLLTPPLASPSSPSSKPWLASTGEKSRVRGLVAAKFEQPVRQESIKIVPKKLNKEIHNTFIANTKPQENKMTAPYLVKSAETKLNTVRKLSDQYDHIGGIPKPQETNNFVPKTKHNNDLPQFKPEFTKVQNYSIRYDQPKQHQQFQQYPSHHQQVQQNYSLGYDTAQHGSQNHPVQYGHLQSSPQHTPQVYQHVPGREMHYTPPQQYNVQTAVCYTQNPNYIPPNTNPTTHQPVRQPVMVHQYQEAANPDQNEVQYKSTVQFKPQNQQNKLPVKPIEPIVQHPPKLQTQISNESVHEHGAVSSRVMAGPQSQTAVTVRQKSPMNREGHDMEAALRNSLYKVNNSDNVPSTASLKQNDSRSTSFKYKSNDSVSPSNSFKYKDQQIKSSLTPNDSFKYRPSDCPKPTVSPSSFKFKSTFEEKKETGVVKPFMQQPKPTPMYNNVTSKPRQSLEINSRGESVLTSQFQIPVINVKTPASPGPPPPAKALSKSDSWHQICLANQMPNKPNASPNSRTIVKSKSSHTLAVPKLFEAGMSRQEKEQKRKAMEAYLIGGKKSPTEDSSQTKVVKRSINRIKTSEKMSAVRHSTGSICRSRTLPDIACPELLDESNVEEAFEDLFKSS